jgi:invasion protein IalB
MRTIISRTLATLLLAVALFGLGAGAASAQEFLGKHGDWNVIGYVENGKRYCYIHSSPTEQSGNYTKRGEPYILVIRGPDGAENVSVTSGYPYKPDADIEVTIGSTAIILFADGEKGWTTLADDDKALVKAMRAGSSLTVRGTSQKGTYSLDSYSLAGVTAALNEIRSSCGN